MVKLRLFLSSRYAVPLFVFVAYFVLNLGITGPAYLSDEIAYLDKAATIAGSVVHISTSWFGGYSLMISPAFLLSSNPYVEWIIILALNALMWAGSALLLRYIIGRLYPKSNPLILQLVTLGSMLYPSWLSMSGYAFSTSGFVLVFMGSLATLLKSNLTNRGWLVIAGLLAGYLCWIHPLGFLFLGIIIAIFVLQMILRKKWWPGLVAVLGSGFALSYILIVQPLFDRLMNGSIANDTHYSSGIADIIHATSTVNYWLQVGLLILGLLLFVIVATFGMAVYGSAPVIRQLVRGRKLWKTNLQDTNFVIKLMSVFLVIAALCFTALSFAATKQLRIDQWVYGRYIDMFLLPLIAFGLLSKWRFKQALVIAGCVVVAGTILSLATNPSNTSFVFDNKVNLQGFWPMQLASIIHANYYWVWGVLGACGVAIAGFMYTKKRRPLLLLLLISIILAGVGNYLYHKTIILQHSTVSSLYTYIKDTYTTTDCIGFTPTQDSNERFNLYSYYLHGYNMRQMTFEQWQKDNCTGPYLTYSPTLSLPDGVQVAGREDKTGLVMIDHIKPSNPITSPIIFN